MTKREHTSRRDFLRLAAGASTALAVGSAAPGAAQAPLGPTPSCPDDARATPRQTEGPFFKPDSPRRTSLLEPGMGGVKIVLSGLVLSTGCRPVARALIDVWHADDRGEYDNGGHRLRGHLFTDDQGRYRLETIEPGGYVGRTRHYHVKVQAPNRPVLTTQLYFPNDPGNERDPIFNRALVMQVRDAAGGKTATFDFVLELGDRPGRG
jgi:protocatechuate 3,4-dioxygenase beta subunit